MKKKSHKNEKKKLNIFTRMFKNRTLIDKNQFSRVQLLVFIGFFGVVGGYVLLKSFASAPIKPPMQGLVLRSPVTPPAGYEGAISGMVVNINWSDLQPNSTNDPIPANNAVDKAITKAKNFNIAHPTTPVYVKMRVMAGVYAPDWAKTMSGFTPIHVIETVSGTTGTIGPFWRADYATAYQHLVLLLAAKYDDPAVGDNALLRDVTVSQCMSIYAETFQRTFTPDPAFYSGDNSWARIYNAGYSVAADQNCLMTQVDGYSSWAHTHVSVAFNPYRYWHLVSGTYKQTTGDEAFTASVMDHCRSVLGTLCVIENNSIRTSFIGQETQSGNIYNDIKTRGPDITLQTATTSQAGDLHTLVSWAISLGTNSVELPTPYSAYAIPDMLTDDQALLNNSLNPGDSPASAPTVTLSASPTTVLSGGSSTLTWSSTNATSCTASGGWSGSKATSGSQSSGALSSTTNFSLSCTGTGGTATASATVIVTPVDITPPSFPANLHSTASSATTVSLAWDASTDGGSGVSGYNIFRNGALVDFTSATNYIDTNQGNGLIPNTSYSYAVDAVDNSDNESIQSSSVSATTTPTNWYSKSTTIYDENNQPVRIMGFDDGRLEDGSTGSLADFQQIKSWGFNALRITINWGRLEQSKPQLVGGNVSHNWDNTYLSSIDTAIQNASDPSVKLKVIIDMHQSKWTDLNSGNGFPCWMYKGTTGTCAADGTVDIGQAKCDWMRDVAENGVIQKPQEGMADVWKMLAARYAGNSTIIGADMFNEPQAADCGSGFTYFPDGTDATYVDDIYDKLGTTIRTATPNWMLFYEDDAYSSYGQYCWALTRPLAMSNTVYSWHFYPFTWNTAYAGNINSCDNSGPAPVANQAGILPSRQMADHLAHAQTWNVPLWIGEFDGLNMGNFDCSALPTGDLIGATASAELLKFMSYTKANNISWTFWEYKRQGSSIIDWQNSKQSPSGLCTSPHTATNLPKQPLLADLLTGIFPTPVVNISAGPNPITAGSATTINWSTTDATSCTASGAWSGSQSTSGSLSTGVLSSNTTYSLDCIGQGGETTASVTVVVNPPGQTFKTGDLNHDGYVNVFDLSILLSHYGGGGSPMQGDINQDSKVDVFDLSTLLTHYGS